MNDIGGKILRGVLTWVAVVCCVGLVLTFLTIDPKRSPGILSDALGPEPGEAVSAYLERARHSVNTVAEPNRQHWALVGANDPWSVDQAAGIVASADRASTVFVQTPRDNAAMPVFDQDMPEPPADQTRGVTLTTALDRVTEAAGLDSDPRSRATADALSAGEPAIIGLVIRANPAVLRSIAVTGGVRMVEALPHDAVAGRFAVRPLLPQQTEFADPLPQRAGPLPQHHTFTPR